MEKSIYRVYSKRLSLILIEKNTKESELSNWNSNLNWTMVFEKKGVECLLWNFKI